MTNNKQSITFLAGRYISHLFVQKLSSDLVFHNFSHTVNVVRGVKEISKHLKIDKESREILILAAWFHDSGHINTYNGHEKESQKLAKEWLTKENYPAEKMESVLACIGATLMPQLPTNLLEEIICDADLYHLSLDEYFPIQHQLRVEWTRILHKDFTERSWMQENILFLHEHRYFTEYGHDVLEKRKKANIKLCEQLMEE